MSKMTIPQIREIKVILVATPDFITLYGNYNTIKLNAIHQVIKKTITRKYFMC